MTDSTEDRLHQVMWAYHAAVQRRDGIEARLRGGELDVHLYGRSLSAADAVVASRLALYRLLIEDGWTPPAAVLQDMAVDGSLLRERADHLG